MRIAAGGEEASESGSSEAEVVRIGESDCRFSGGGISISRVIGVSTSESESGILSSLPAKMKHEELFHHVNRV